MVVFWRIALLTGDRNTSDCEGVDRVEDIDWGTPRVRAMRVVNIGELHEVLLWHFSGVGQRHSKAKHMLRNWPRIWSVSVKA
jgi:hypothetical protein